MTRAAQRAADSLAASVLNNTASGYGEERSDVLEAIAATLKARASELRAERIEKETT